MLNDDARWLRTLRTLTQAEVDARAAVRDKLTPTPDERLNSAAHSSDGPEPSRH